MTDQPTKQKLWGGRFTGTTDPLMHAFNQSLKYDQRMHAADIRGSIAYAKALARVGILSRIEEATIIDGLQAVGREWDNGQFAPAPDDEDIHTANERRLSELIGPLGGKLHTGRSRNDQVATDMRLWLLDEAEDVLSSLKGLVRVMVERADKERDILLPGYTHLQRGQPIRWSHFLLSHAFSFKNDLERLQQLIPRISVLPLGSGALAGNPFAVDREFLAKELGFLSLAENSMWGVGDRDFIVEFLMWSSLTMTHMSRLAEDLIIYSTAEFGFVTLSDAYSTGSSIMPQKKNPDSLELLRGKSGRIFGNMAGFLMTLKGLPSTYNKDLQEDKEPLFDSVDNVSASLKIAEGVIATMSVHGDKMRAALTMDVLATDLADYLVRKGVPFRETHHVSGRAVALAEARKCQLNDLSVEDYKGLHEKFEDDVLQVFDFEASVERRTAIGGPSRKTLDRQISVLRAALD
ncbi:putative argininosuccinate lyase [Paxillus ammoniavirescens]|nr:putative argininosuccinate lyase [Paxillus ammoniavirescens]